MKRTITALFLAMILFVPLSQLNASEIITNKTILQLIEIGLSEDLIITKIENSNSNFSVEIDDIIRLKEQGMSDNILSAMITSHGEATLAPDLLPPVSLDEITTLITNKKFQEAYAKLAEFKQTDPTNRNNDLIELQILVAEASDFIARKDPSWKIKTKAAAIKLKKIYRTYYTDTTYWMAYADYYWMLGRESGTLKCLKKVHYYDPDHIDGLILKGEAIMKSLIDTPYSDEDSEAMFRESFMDQGREAFRSALQSPEITDMKKAEVYYKLAVYEKEIFKNKTRARKFFRKTMTIAPDTDWAKLAQDKLNS